MTRAMNSARAGNAVSSQIDRLPSSMGDAEFDALRSITYELTGIRLDNSKRSMLYARIVRRLRALGIHSFQAYIDEVKRPNSAELGTFVNTVTTNLTYFFREPHHFDVLAKAAIPDLQHQHSNSTLRIWSSASSSGEEPYSIAIVLAELGLIGGQDYRLLATDLDTNMVEKTAQGRFNLSSARGLDDERKKRWFTQSGHDLIAKPELQQGLISKQLNLFEAWPIRAGIDIIFCRNVLIYFGREDQDKIITGFRNMQRPGGYLFLGHSESMRDMDAVYERVDNTVYRRL